MLDTIWQDIRYAARSLRQAPGFTLAALLTLALGIGATTTIFTIVNAALLKPPPYPEPDRLLVLTAPDAGAQSGQLFLHMRDHVRVFDRVAAQRRTNGWNLVAGDFVTYVPAMRVSEGYFDAHRVPPLLGRGFSRAEDQPGAANVVVISEGLWQRAYAGRTDALGQTMLLGGVPHTVVGIMPATFRSIPDAEVWTPLRTNAADNTFNYRVIGRLRAGATQGQAVAELDTLRGDIQRAFPRTNPRRLAATTWMPLQQVLGLTVREYLLMLLGAVGFLLLIACINVGSLQLTRALARRREMATRAALGGSRIRLARQVIVESGLLALLGGLAGIAVAVGSAQLLLGLVSEDLARQMLSGQTVNVDWRVLGFALSIALLASLFFGIVPALAASRADLLLAMKEGITTTVSRRTTWLRRSLAGAEVALAVVLLVAAGLLVRTLLNLTGTEPGFNPTAVTVGRMSLQGLVEDGPALESLLQQSLGRVRRLPGVVAAAASNGVPIERPFNMALEPPAGGRITEIRVIDWRYVTPEYFNVFDIPPVAGRMFDERDRSGGNSVAIVNEAFARAFFGRVDVVGETINLVAGMQEPPRQIVGVVGDVKTRSGAGRSQRLTALGSGSAPTMFVPAGQASATSIRGTHGAFPMTWSIKTERPGPEVGRELQDAVRAVDRRLTFVTFEPMDAVIARDLDIPRFAANLIAGFAGLAILLAGIGLYGLMAYSASQRTREVGIRMAVGATAARIVRRFMAEGLAVACVGLLTGIVGATFVTRVLVVLLFGVTPLDAATFATVGAVLLAIAALATLIPAARAARINPIQALRLQ